MSSFKRKSCSKSTKTLPGTRPSPATPHTTVTSVGIPSLDDILGGGLPLSCTLLVLAPDAHSSYGELVQKYFVAQGLSSGQSMIIVDDYAEDFVRGVMWVPSLGQAQDEDEDEKVDANSDQIKIAWRYANMKQFQTTVVSSSQDDEFCQTFDLTNRVPASVIDQALETGRLLFVPVSGGVDSVLQRIKDNLQSWANTGPVRICVRSLGSPEWGDVGRQDILRFLHSVRSELREMPYACASLSLACHLSAAQWGGTGWVQKLGWMSDGCITMAGFSGKGVPRCAVGELIAEMCRQPVTVCSVWIASWDGADSPAAGATYAGMAERQILEAAGAVVERGEQLGVPMHAEAACCGKTASGSGGRGVGTADGPDGGRDGSGEAGKEKS
ncbi:hypothetical protein APHAL10511_006233 [Amanita phalloides]|nr:hypothetical protein APHAL10511_006233 [Amanita phalloides]